MFTRLRFDQRNKKVYKEDFFWESVVETRVHVINPSKLPFDMQCRVDLGDFRISYGYSYRLRIRVSTILMIYIWVPQAYGILSITTQVAQ